MIYHHSLNSKFVPPAGHFTKNKLISDFFSFLLSHDSSFQVYFHIITSALPFFTRPASPISVQSTPVLSFPSNACHLLARLNRLHPISLPVFTEKHKTSCCLLQPPVSSSLCRPHVSLNTIFSSHPSLCRPSPSLTHTQSVPSLTSPSIS